MEPRPKEFRDPEPYIVQQCEEGWGIYRTGTNEPIVGPWTNWGDADRSCQAMNRRAKALRPQDV